MADEGVADDVADGDDVDTIGMFIPNGIQEIREKGEDNEDVVQNGVALGWRHKKGMVEQRKVGGVSEWAMVGKKEKKSEKEGTS